MINLNRIVAKTTAEGPGLRTCVWVQGCSRHCEGCFAVDTWQFEERIPTEAEEILSVAVKEGTEGITILGGEPLEQAAEIISLSEKAKALGLSVVLFTGFTKETIERNEKFRPVLDCVDVLIDGPFEKEKKDFSRPLVGSSNQRFFFLTDRYSMKDFGQNKLEIRISPGGRITVNGQGDVSYFRKEGEK